ncbi:phage tail protein, partial [Enterobacter roggenkampii]|uniref:phage tail protein n=1 Tax=Enterobacter roggenkampii TaxID=1812935 RepID=UPI003D6EFA00
FTSANAAALTALSSIGRDIVGKATVADVLTYLGLGEGSALPVGVPIPWPSATPPTGWLKCNGAAFTASQYSKLAQAYPALRLPDLRGEFIRGWDDGRGVDQGRSLLSNQSDAFASHNHYIRTTSSVTSSTDDGDPARGQIRGSVNTAGGVGSDKSIGMSGGSETRPRNIAFNYIVRAA